MSEIRNTNQSRLPRLPPEIILLITEDDSLEWEDLRRLRHVCSFLFHRLGKRVLKARDLFFFRNACLHANVDILVECLKYNVTPTGTMWKGRHSTPGQIVVDGFRKGNFSVERFKETWQWLSDNGYEVHGRETRHFSDPNGERYTVFGQTRTFPDELLYMIWDATDARHLQATCDAIHFVVDKGMAFPMHIDNGNFNFERVDLRPVELMELLMLPDCPASILELHLKQLGTRGLTLKTPIKNQEAWPEIYRREETEINVLLDRLFEYHFDLHSWAVQDPRRIGDDLESKIEVLAKYSSINDGEKRVLKDILRGLRKVESKRIDQGNLDFDRDGLWCWHELSMSIAYIATDDSVLARVVWDNHRYHKETAIHGFEHNWERWYPPKTLAYRRGRRAERRGPVDPSRYEDRTKGEWWNMPLSDWDFFMRDFPHWCKGSRERDTAVYVRARERRLRNGEPEISY
jgi:hypothetical protein